MSIEKKKVLFASKSLCIGGMEKALVTLLNSFDFSKYSVTLVLEEKKGELLPFLDKRVNVLEYYVSSNRIPLIRKMMNFANQFIFKLRYGKKFDFSCCYATYSNACGKVALMASKNSSLYVHSDYYMVYNQNEKQTVAFFESIYFKDYKHIFFVSESSMKSVSSLFPKEKDRFCLLGNLIDAKDILEKSKQSNVLLKEKTEYRFVFVGRLDDSSKKLQRLIDAVSLLKQEGFVFSLYIVGDGPDYALYKEHTDKLGVSDIINFCGMQENPYPFMRESDCIVLCSDYEGFPVVYAEAMLLECDIVTTVKANDGYVSVNEENAFISEKNSIDLANKMKDAISGKKKNDIKLDIDRINQEKLDKLYTIIGG